MPSPSTSLRPSTVEPVSRDVASRTEGSPTPALITLQQAAQDGYAAYSTLRKYIAQGRLPAVKIGTRVKVRRSDLERLAVPVRADGKAAIDAVVQRLVEAAPQLTHEQITRLSAALGDAR